MNLEKKEKTARSNMPLIMMLVVFSAPAIMGCLVYKSGLYKQFGTSNQGKFIEAELTLNPSDYLNDPPRDMATKNAWHMVYFVPEQCATTCKNILFLLRQIPKALGPDKHKITPVLLSSTNQTESALPIQQAGLSSNLVFFDKPVQLTQQIDAMLAIKSPVENPPKNAALQNPATRDNTIFLVDPSGHFVPFYPQSDDQSVALSNGRAMMKDIRKAISHVRES